VELHQDLDVHAEGVAQFAGAFSDLPRRFHKARSTALITCISAEQRARRTGVDGRRLCFIARIGFAEPN
jgi:hypothetical protein